jgi:eukaryotic-like serine/threonine-protein kinase
MAAFLVSLPASCQITPMFRGNLAHTGVYASAPVEQFGKIKWKFQTGGRVISSPAVANGMVYFGSTDGYLYALM